MFPKNYDNYYFRNLIKYKNYYKEHRMEKLKYQKEYNETKKKELEKLINYEIIIRQAKKKDNGISIKHGEFIVDFD